VFYNKLKSITNGFLNKVINHSILRSNLFLLKYYLSFKSRLKKASLKQLKKRLSKRLLRLKKKSSGRLKRVIKLKSLTCDYNKLNV
jgi:hypothetical protein